MFAQVIIDLSHSNVDKVFEYKIPDNLDYIDYGWRVLVPFGRGNKPIDGYIIGISEFCSLDENKIKTIIKTLDDYSVLLKDQIELALWMKEEYFCNLADVLRLMLPSELRTGKVSVKYKTIVKLNPLLTDEQLENFEKSLYSKNGKLKAPKQKEVLELLNVFNQGIEKGEINKHINNANSAIDKMTSLGILCLEKTECLRSPFTKEASQGEQNQPTPTQTNVINEIISSIDDKGETFLLHGVTGSGKTEVYLRCISYCIEQNKSAIMLVPEIALTPQTVERFRSRFQDNIAVLHSRLSAGERYDEWRRIRSGNVKVVVGARSAIFAPFKNIGLIVIDEEHESSYNSDKTPRYKAVEVAQKRCELAKATLLLGSATPSLESYYNVQKGQSKLLELNERINNRPLPEVRIVDMRAEFATGNKTIFSAPLYHEIKETLKNKKQIILFINRRGYSSFVSCRGCGYVFKCSKCDVSMTFHKNTNLLKCHYCGFEQEMPAVCPECSKPYIKQFGVGTQQVEEQVNLHFPYAKTLRMDHDTTQRKNAHEKILSRFASQEADILIGTQMIAKGLDFPNVTLVGIIAADSSLFVPDYRSAEKTFSLLTQVEGRAGRDNTPGKVVVQSYSPENPSIVLASKHDYNRFYKGEIVSRKNNEFPPFADFIRFIFMDEDELEAERKCNDAKIELEHIISKTLKNSEDYRNTIIYISATKAPINYINSLFRYQLLIKLRRNELSKDVIKAAALYMKQDIKMPFLELNPQNLM